MDSTLRQICTNLSQAVVVTDAEGRVELVNAVFTAMCGHSTEELIGKKPGNVLQGPGTAPHTVAVIRQKLAARQPFHGRILNYHADGHHYWVDLNISPIFDQKGQLQNFIAFEREIESPAANMVSTCMFCKKFREFDSERWLDADEFYTRKLGMELSHGICPMCMYKCLDAESGL
jgi:PAS domain S-box-containing protein